ncbi:hypothetical protein BS47DRAFT_610351 [Hydnum rufescens UP504]|uniref:Uncharacterized protein n=1 Tax=Hydnum rufescens UP504 TaxID=1448309 RepID=A0A9P6B354_9AGAM|nr:hypothetical protein BS47DRAFT_610351 [Hydnum rufescens UP504]
MISNNDTISNNYTNLYASTNLYTYANLNTYANAEDILALLHDYIPAVHDATLIRPRRFEAPSPSLTISGTTISGTPISGTTNRGTTNAGTTDAGTTDAGETDAGTTDAGTIGIMNARVRWGNVMVSRYTVNLINAVEAEANTS